VLAKQDTTVGQAQPFAEQRGTSPAARRRRAIFGLLHRAEQHGLTGLIRISAATVEVGQLIVDRGRVCLAASAELDATPDPQTDDDRAWAPIVNRAVSQGISLSRCVEDMDGTGIERLRASLRTICAHALRRMGDALASTTAPPDLDVHRARQDYDHRLTSSALEVFLACTADTQLDGSPISRAYAAFSASGATALFAQLERGGRTAPVLTTGYNLGSLTLRAAISTVRSAAELCRSWPMPDAESLEPACVVLSGDGGTWACFASRSGLALFRHSDSSKTEALINWALSRAAFS
jgi:hypothetical protein